MRTFFSAIWGWSNFDANSLQFGAESRKSECRLLYRNLLVSFQQFGVFALPKNVTNVVIAIGGDPVCSMNVLHNCR